MCFWLIIQTHKAFSLTFTHSGKQILQTLKLYFVPGFCPAVAYKLSACSYVTYRILDGLRPWARYCRTRINIVWHLDTAATSNSYHSEVKRLAASRSVLGFLKSRETPRCRSVPSRSRPSPSNRSLDDGVCVLFCPGIPGAVGLAGKSGTQHTHTAVCSAQFPWRLENSLALPLHEKENEALFCLPSLLHKASENSSQPFKIY